MGAPKVAVVGAGSWGTTIAGLLASKSAAREVQESGGADVVLWGRDPVQVEAIARERCNRRYLPEFVLAPELRLTACLDDAVSGAAVVVMAVPARWARQVMEGLSAAAPSDAIVVNLAKGLEPPALLTMSQLTAEVMPGHPVAALAGPNLAPEIAMGLPAASVVACGQQDVAVHLQQLLSLPNLRVYTNDDVIGCEIAGCVKNVLALGAGMADGWGAGANAKAAIITRGVGALPVGSGNGWSPLDLLRPRRPGRHRPHVYQRT